MSDDEITKLAMKSGLIRCLDIAVIEWFPAVRAFAGLVQEAERERCSDEEIKQPIKADFIERTNTDYAAWCRTYYEPGALDERGMQSLHGLWAWQEQERRLAAAVAAERERCAQYLRDAAARLAPEGKRINQIDRHVAHVLACKGDELAAGCAWRDVGGGEKK